ncbi:hypothetical protein I352_03886 [Cryptococcus deuterogattii MMRL2647]|nr:hypothetical protein I352_03886 [Cryptococcus deuterogattii MMRL2647]
MVNGDVVGHQGPVTFCPRVPDVLPDSFSLTSRLPALLDLLQTQHPDLLERVKKHFVLLPCLSEIS